MTREEARYILKNKSCVDCAARCDYPLENQEGECEYADAIRMAIEALQQPERKKGRWIRNDNGTYSCSVCQSWIPEEQYYYARYCLYCGFDMRGEN